MEDRGVPKHLRKLTHKEIEIISSANRDRGHRPEPSERDQIREFIHELYEELLGLAVAARSVLHWPLAPANEIAPANPIQRLDPNYCSRTTTEDEARENGLDKTLADSFPSSDPPSTIPDPPEPGGQSEAPNANEVRRESQKRR
jgi:hypothetical protein